MKNKLHYLLWVVYALVVIFIMQINKVFTPNLERTSMEKMNIVLNVIFLLLIGVLFVFSTIGFNNLNKLTNSLSKITDLVNKEDRDSYDMNSKAIWNRLNDTKTHFGHPLLDKAMAEYRAQLKRNGSGFATAKTVSIEDFVNDSLLEKAAMNHFISVMPGTLTGLGILGTFIGLSLGLASFSGDDIYTISDNVGPLLSGMKVAFHTSVYGIFFSLVFTFIYRGVMSIAYQKLDSFLTTFKYYTNLAPEESEATASMLIYQANTAALLKEILANLQGNSLEQTEALSNIVNRFCDQMTFTLNADFQALSRALKESSESHRGSAELFKGLTTTTYELVEINRQMINTLDAISKEQVEIEKRLEMQEAKIDRTCDDISARLYTYGLTNSLNQ